ncbi:four-carbon acid sugar kinase family protein [Ornithinimicrobium cerasi]|uniref:four-carbon acid sugar kinase family protein n=1 Tax=Ornithinimicrobium cerasi TaxID=2248773 RepID=UPI000EFEB800|nr:four-carbon acid sugar kinase family protein [Ornithinimicrobium cerasi]
MSRICFVADDLTGASDVLALAHRLGLSAILLLNGDDAGLGADHDVVGLATPARSLSGDALRATVRDAASSLAPLAPAVLLYKVCSTFDSSPTTGSIGAALETLLEGQPDHGPVPVIPAQPAFGRYTAFSQHFARAGEQVYRLDRHPIMSCHPSTPMDESDLRLVLSGQLTGTPDIPGLALPDLAPERLDRAWARHRSATPMAFIVDALDEVHLRDVGRQLLADVHRPALVAGSGGMMTGLGLALGGSPIPQPEQRWSTGPVLAVSASASATTAAQIDHAIEHGWVELPLITEARDVGVDDTTVQRLIHELTAGRSVIVHTARGPHDPRVASDRPLPPSVAGQALAALVRAAVQRGLTRDVAVLGGDTSTHTLLNLGVRSLRVAEQFVVGAPVCAADSDSVLAGCRILLKGGQVGGPDVLTAFAGKTRPNTPPPATAPDQETP